jgi:exoribonuclease II
MILMTIKPGDILEIFEQKRLMSALCLGLKNNRLTIVTETGKLMALSHSRVIHHTPTSIDPTSPRKELVARLRDISTLRDNIAENCNLEKIWGSIDCRGQMVFISKLAGNDPGTAIDPKDHEAGFLRAIHSDKRFFKSINGSIYVFSETEVQENLARIEAREKEHAIVTHLVKWLDKKIREPRMTESPPAGYDRLVTALKADVTQITAEPGDKNLLSSVMKQLRPGSQWTHFKLLVLLGEFGPDENLDFIKFRYPPEFSKEAWNEVHSIVKRSFIAGPERTNLEALPCMTIDNQKTLDYDDAISFVELPGHRYEVGIHITDICHWIQPGSFLDEEARERGQTLYLPPKTWHMFPQVFAETIASLRLGVSQPAISIFAVLAENGTVENTRFFRSVIRIAHRLTYDDVDSDIDSEPFKSLLNIVTVLQENRLKNGAVIMPRPEITIDAQNPGKLIIHRRNRQSASQLIVSELMILANNLVAKLAAQSGIAFPYRHQKKAEEPVPKSNFEFDPYISYCQRRVMPRADYSIKPRPHHTLGLDYYTNITSPIRRYFDVLAQRQFLSLLGFDEPYATEELAGLLNDLESSVSRATTISMHQHRYWLLKYLAGCQGDILEAMVLDRVSNGYQIWLKELCLDAFLPLSFAHKLYPEQLISVVIERVVPRENLLKLRLKEE